MILAIDIGNTSIALGGFLGDELKFVVRLSTDITKTEDEYASKLRNILEIHGVNREGIDGAIISSVVPPLNTVMKSAVKLAYGVDALTVCPGIKTGIGILCDSPSSVGADLICCGNQVGGQQIQRIVDLFRCHTAKPSFSRYSFSPSRAR